MKGATQVVRVALGLVALGCSSAQASCPAGEYLDTVSQRCEDCTGCGAYQDEEGQTTCKFATVETCPEGSVPRFTSSWASGKTSLEEACKPVSAGYYFVDQTGTTAQTCFPVERCEGCGAYQDLTGQTECKTATVETCPESTVPRFANSFSGFKSLEEACKPVPAGSYFTDEAGSSSSTCFPVETCEGCGAYQDLAGQTECKTATRATCPADHVPRDANRWSSIGYATLEAACAYVGPGFRFTDDASSCYPISACSGCGAYQDLAGQTTCKIAARSDCPANNVPKFTSSGSYSPPKTAEEACKPVEPGYFYVDQAGDSSSTCFPISTCEGCGAYQDEPGQTTCKVATVATCPDNWVPDFTRFSAAPSLAAACKEVSPGEFYEDKSGTTSSECFPVSSCSGCGVYQDEPGQTSCKTVSLEQCGADRVPNWQSRATSISQACKQVDPGYYYTPSEENCYPVSSCSGCGEYQDLPKQTSCKVATLDTCPSGSVPKRPSFFTPSATLEDACEAVPAGSFFRNSTASCFAVEPCYGCGVYQDEPGQAFCKRADLDACGATAVPRYTSRFSTNDPADSLEAACKTVEAGYVFENQTGDSSSSCYPVTPCQGCGTYQDEPKQTTCKVTDRDVCGSTSVPAFTSEPTTTLDEACALVPAGYVFQNTRGSRKSECFPVSACEGCGVFQDEPGQETCKQASCGAGQLPLLASAAASEAEACGAAPASPGWFQADGCLHQCTGCGAYQDATGQSACKVASQEECPEGSFPGIVRGAASISEACVTPESDQIGYLEEKCAFAACFGFSSTEIFACESLRRNGHDNCSHATMTDKDWEIVKDYKVLSSSVCLFSDEPSGGCDCANPPTPAPTTTATNPGAPTASAPNTSPNGSPKPTASPTVKPDTVGGGGGGLQPGTAGGDASTMSTGLVAGMGVVVALACLTVLGVVVYRQRRGRANNAVSSYVRNDAKLQSVSSQSSAEP